MMDQQKDIRDIFRDRPCLSPDELSAYCRGELSKQLQHEIEAHLIDCALCSAAVEGWMEQGQPEPEKIAADRDKVWEKIRQLRQRPAGARVRRLSPLWRNVAAVFAVLVAGWLIYQATQTHPSPNKLFSEYYEPYQIDFPLHYRNDNGAGPDLPEPLQQGFEALDRQQYEESIPFLEEWLKRDPDNDVVQFFLAQALMAQGKLDEALPLFEKVHQRSESAYREAATWYLALIHLKNNRTAQAVSLLDSLRQSNGYYSRQAEALLSRLR
ncbi:MAG: hypothetical protein D6818_06185 [Bacteroidetes bacterium]|nr:MAG: hypothetical protein D6818_06185 [Bacteroidota bacterium]